MGYRIGLLFVGFVSLSRNRSISESILNGALTSELIFEWLGLYVITMSCSIVSSLNKNSLHRDEIVTVRVYAPLKSACWRNHLSRTILRQLLFSIDVSTRNWMISVGLVWISLANIRTRDCTIEGMRDLKILWTTHINSDVSIRGCTLWIT